MKDLYFNPEISIIKFTVSNVLSPSLEIEVPDVIDPGELLDDGLNAVNEIDNWK